jgi:hypothetical protein
MNRVFSVMVSMVSSTWRNGISKMRNSNQHYIPSSLLWMG